MQRIQSFSGAQYLYTSDPNARKEYDGINVEYATSSYQLEHDMFPGLIAIPRTDNDIQEALRFANQYKYPVSIMSGGHQYSGACSTDQNGVQLNLQSTYRGAQDLTILPSPPAPDENKVLVNASVSYSLREFNDFLTANHLFVPHGQCSYVHLGGHAQTGGYGQLIRSFGLLGDHVWGLRMICYDGTIQEISKGFRADLLNAILGGSPGNFGVITHYIIEVHRDADHYFPETNAVPRGFKAIWLYNETVLKTLLNEVATMAETPDFPRNFDLSVNAVSFSFALLDLEPVLKDLQDDLSKKFDEVPSNDDAFPLKWPAVVVLYAQWVPMSKEDGYTSEVDEWFQKFKKLANQIGCLHKSDLELPMSRMTGEWLFHGRREFDYPYIKRAYVTNSVSLVQDKWADALVQQISKVVKLSSWNTDFYKNCFVSAQIQCFGGNNSQFFANRNNGTSYSWRDSTVGFTLDCFHKNSDFAKSVAQKWQDQNDSLMKGQHSPFSKRDKRLLWSSYGDWVMDNVWPMYYEDQEKYEKIGRQRALADPNGTFTPNPFNVRPVNVGSI